MTSRLIDIKETTELENVIAYQITRAKNSPGESIDIVIAGIFSDYSPGESFTFKEVEWEVTMREYTTTANGYTTRLSAVDPISNALRKAPSKTLAFMSMTTVEKSEFEVGIKGDYASLEYIPYIKTCNEETLSGGWTAAQVVNQLAGRMGLSVYYAVPDYTVKQVMCGNDSSYYSTIQSLVSAFETDMWIKDGTLYIMSKGVGGGTLDFSNISSFTQREVMNFDSKITDLWVVGGYGQWSRARSGEWMHLEEEKEVELETVTESDQQRYMTINFKGDMETINRETGKTSVSGGTMQVVVPMSTPNEDQTTRTETILIDVYGNRKALLSEHIVKYNETMGAVVLDELTEYTYDFLDEKYDKPREIGRITYRSEYQWLLFSMLGYSKRYFKNKNQTTETSRIYGDNGNLLCEFSTRKADCLRLVSSGLFASLTFVELALADLWWVEDGATPPDIYNIVVEESETRYRQITPDMFEISTSFRSPKGLRRKQGDELRGTSIQHVRGRVPRHPRSYRKSHILVTSLGNTAGGSNLDMPCVKVSMPNIIRWVDAERIHGYLSAHKLGYDYICERVYTLPVDINVGLGWKVTFGSQKISIDETIPAIPNVSDGRVVAYSKSKDSSGNMQTVITVEGRVSV